RMRMADGFWAPEDMRWIDSVLANLSDSNQPLIFITHYPLDKGIANWYEVLDRLKNFNTQLTLFGHGHRNRIYDFESIPGIMCRTYLRGNEDSGGYTIAEIKTDTIFFFERIPDKQTDLWYQLPLVQRNYEAFVQELVRPDYSVNEKYPEVKELWSFNTGFTIGSSAALYKNSVICGDASGKVYSLNTDNGEINWTFQTGGPIYSTPDISNNQLVFGSSDSSIYCLDADDGSLLWKYKTYAAVLGCPVIDDEIVYIGGSDRTFRAFNINYGNVLWEFNDLNGFVETKPVIYDDKILFGAWDEHFYCLDKNSGGLNWKWKGDRRGVLYSPAVCWPVASDRVVFFAAPDRTLNAIDINSGKTLWRTGEFEVRETIGISENKKTLFIRTMNDTLLALPASRELEKNLWLKDAGFGYDISSAQIVEIDGIVLYATKTGELYALKSDNGEILWIHKLSSGYINTITPITSKKIVTTGFDGMIKLIGIEK
ncbi:MAG TPA: PQQ-binding-like beta-propeller repeat protein, partial [Ignavibacteriaceae bacterium]|nr:PQQ-binding-like beta-propeller repeat protein [Ignavibacteriaceae bacterium]